MKPFIGSYFSFSKGIFGILCLLIGAFIFLYISYFELSIFSKKSETTLILLDRSLSMAVEDEKSGFENGHHSRLSEAKEIIISKLLTRKNFGIITYAKNPTLLIPLSRTQDSFKNTIESVSPEIEVGGSDLPLALEFAKNLYAKDTLEVVIFTDGGSTSLIPFPEIPKNWRIILVGLGSEHGGKIPLGYNANGEQRYKYFSGAEVVVPYSPKEIESISKKIDAIIFEKGKYSDWNNDSLAALFQKNVLYFFAGFFTILGILIHPYVRRKKL